MGKPRVYTHKSPRSRAKGTVHDANERLYFRQQVAQGMLQHKPRQKIADELGISLSYVKLIASKVRTEWRARADIDIASMRGQEIAKLDLMESELWKAWYKSLEDQQSSTTERSSEEVALNIPDEALRAVPNLRNLLRGQTGTKVREKVLIRTAGQSGNPAYMQALIMIAQRRADLLGLDTPVTGQNSGVVDWGELLRQVRPQGRPLGVEASAELPIGRAIAAPPIIEGEYQDVEV